MFKIKESNFIVLGILLGLAISCTVVPSNAGLFDTDLDSRTGTYELLNHSVVKEFGVDNFYINFTHTNEPSSLIFVDFVGYNFSLYIDRVYNASDLILATNYYYNSTEPIDNWIIIVNYTALTVDLKTSEGFNYNMTEIVSIEGLEAFFIYRWGIFSYIIVMLFPVGMFIRTHSIGGFAITQLLIASIGFVLPEEIAIIGILPLGLAFGSMLYRVIWKKGKW